MECLMINEKDYEKVKSLLNSNDIKYHIKTPYYVTVREEANIRFENFLADYDLDSDKEEEIYEKYFERYVHKLGEFYYNDDILSECTDVFFENLEMGGELDLQPYRI